MRARASGRNSKAVRTKATTKWMAPNHRPRATIEWIWELSSLPWNTVRDSSTLLLPQCCSIPTQISIPYVSQGAKIQIKGNLSLYMDIYRRKWTNGGRFLDNRGRFLRAPLPSVTSFMILTQILLSCNHFTSPASLVSYIPHAKLDWTQQHPIEFLLFPPLLLLLLLLYIYNFILIIFFPKQNILPRFLIYNLKIS